MTTFTDEVRSTSSPYKFGGSRRAVAAYLISLDGGCDEETGSVEWLGWYGRIGRDILQEDSRGFVDVFTYASEDEARAAFTAIDEEYAAAYADEEL